MKKKTELQKAIHAARGVLGTNVAVARHMGVPIRTLEDWQAGRRTPSPYVAYAMVDRLKMIVGETPRKADKC